MLRFPLEWFEFEVETETANATAPAWNDGVIEARRQRRQWRQEREGEGQRRETRGMEQGGEGTGEARKREGKRARKAKD